MLFSSIAQLAAELKSASVDALSVRLDAATKVLSQANSTRAPAAVMLATGRSSARAWELAPAKANARAVRRLI